MVAVNYVWDPFTDNVTKEMGSQKRISETGTGPVIDVTT